MGKVEQLGSKVETVAITVERSRSKVESKRDIRIFPEESRTVHGESRTTLLKSKPRRY